MKILLNDNLDAALCHDLPGHDVKSVSHVGWTGLTQQDLLTRAAKEYEVFITLDSDAYYQKGVAQCKIPILAIKAESNSLAATRPLMKKVMDVLPSIHTWKIMVIS